MHGPAIDDACFGRSRRAVPSPPPGSRRARGDRPAEALPVPSAPTAATLDGENATELALPAFDARLLMRRAAIPALVVAVLVVAVIVSDAPLQAFADALGRALDADARWVAAAVVFELLSFGGYIVLLWLVAGRATPRLGLRASAQITLGGAAATRLLPAGGLGGVAMTIWALRRAGLGTREATRTLLTFLVLVYSVFFSAIAVAGGSLALGLSAGEGPLSLSAGPAAVALAVLTAGLLLSLRRPAAAAPARPGASRSRRTLRGLTRAPASLGTGVRDALATIRGGDPRLLGAFAWWTFDAAVLWAMLHALGTPPALAIVVLAYFVGQLANTLPLPGVVSGGMVGVLLAFGVQFDLALASVFAYRAVAIWLPTPIGIAALRGLRTTVTGWARQDAALAESARGTGRFTREPQAAAVAVPA